MKTLPLLAIIPLLLALLALTRQRRSKRIEDATGEAPAPGSAPAPVEPAEKIGRRARRAEKKARAKAEKAAEKAAKKAGKTPKEGKPKKQGGTLKPSTELKLFGLRLRRTRPEKEAPAPEPAPSVASGPALESYAKPRGLSYSAATHLPDVTSLLRGASDSKALNYMAGTLPGALKGALAHYLYHGGPNAPGVQHDLTVVLAYLPPESRDVASLLCYYRRLRLHPVEGIEVITGNPEFDRAYRVVVERPEDHAAAVGLLGGRLAEWLVRDAPRGISFELERAMLCVSIPGHLTESGALDAFCQAAGRIHGTLQVRPSPPPGGGADPDTGSAPPAIAGIV